MLEQPRPNPQEAASDLFRLLAENAEDYAVFSTDRQHRVLSWHKGAQRLFGYREDEIIGQSSDCMWTPEDLLAKVPEREMKASLELGSCNDDRWHVRKGGSRFWSGGTMISMRDHDRNAQGFAFIMRDRTDWKLQLEAASTILFAALDCIITMDFQGNVVEFNPAAERTFGYQRADVLGRELASLIIPPSARERHQKGLAHYLKTKEGPVLGKRIEISALHADGTEFMVELAITRVPTQGQPLFTAYLRDISDRVRNEQLRSIRLAVTQHLTQMPNVEEAALGVLRSVCDHLRWDAGLFWTIDQKGDSVECLTSWHRDDEAVATFTEASCSRTFRRGEGLPGRVWSSGQPAWILDVRHDANFPRAALAANADLHSAFACPIVVGDKKLGVIEFYTRHIREPDAELLETMTSIAGHVGQFLEGRRAQDTILRSERDLNDFFQNAAIGLHWVGPDGLILRANRAQLQMLGYSEEEYVGHHIADFFADNEVIRDILQRTLAGERIDDYPARLRCKDGSIRDVLIDSNALFEGSRFVHARCFTRDITDRKRFEGALRESEEKLRLLADTIPQLAWMAKPDGHIFWYNRRWYEYTGTTTQEMEGWGWQSVHDAAVLPEVLTRWKGSIASGEPFEMVFPLKGADRLFRPFLCRVNPLHDANGRVITWFGTNTDISDIKRMEDELRDADRRKDEFLAMLAHELRNPLAPLRNSLQLMKIPRVDAATTQRMRDIMERQVNHLVRLVDDLLDVSRAKQGKIILSKEPVDLATVMTHGAETSQPLLEGKGHRLNISCPDESLFVDGDPIRLAQVIGNLLTNAAKYTDANGHIQLSASREDNTVVLRVQDDGIGIAPNVLPHVFELFSQADHAASRSQGGLGIGLTLVKKLVELHGGSVEARSAGLDKGAEFFVRLPIMHQDRSKSIEIGNTASVKSSSKLRLLVVDDNEDAAESLAMLLRLQGHEVRVAHDGVTALGVAVDFLPALIFLDIGMPGMDGYEVARRLRTMPALQSTVLTALTGWGQAEDRRRSADAGFDHHLVKPPELKAVEALLADLSQQS